MTKKKVKRPGYGDAEFAKTISEILDKVMEESGKHEMPKV